MTEKSIRKIFKNNKQEYAEIRLEQKETTSVVYSGRELEEASKKYSRGGCIRVFNKGGWGFSSFNNTDDISYFFKKANEAAELTGRSNKDPVGLASVTDNKNFRIPLKKLPSWLENNKTATRPPKIM